MFPGMVSSLRPPCQANKPVDVLPEGLSGDIDTHPAEQPAEDNASDPSPLQPLRVRLRVAFRTLANSFGLLRQYHKPPACPPSVPGPPPASSPNYNHPSQGPSVHSLPSGNLSLLESAQAIISPLPNLSTFRLAHWFYTGGPQRSQASGDSLIHDILLAEDFNPRDLAGVNFAAINKLLDDIDSQPQSVGCGDGWRSSNVVIFIPKPHSSLARDCRKNASTNPEEYGEPFLVCGFWHRSLVDVINSHFSTAPPSRPIEYVPHKLVWTKPDGSKERVRGELYTSDAWLAEHEAVQNLEINTRQPCYLERAIAALMFYSDATHVAQFGQNSIWPVYLYFGNESKYYRRKPTARVCEHVAYLIKVSQIPFLD